MIGLYYVVDLFAGARLGRNIPLTREAFYHNWLLRVLQ